MKMGDENLTNLFFSLGLIADTFIPSYYQEDLHLLLSTPQISLISKFIIKINTNSIAQFPSYETDFGKNLKW